MHQPAHDVFILQPLNQLMFKLVGDGIAALAQRAHLQGVAHFGAAPVDIAHMLPEGVAVFRRRDAAQGLLRAHGAGCEVRADALVHLAIHLLRTFHAVDGMAEIHHFLFHALVLLGVLGAHYAIFAGMFIQKSPGLIPGFGALLTQFKNLIHRFFSFLSLIGFDQIQPSAQLICGNAGVFALCSRRQSSGFFLLSRMTALQPEPYPRFGILAIHCAHC